MRSRLVTGLLAGSSLFLATLSLAHAEDITVDMQRLSAKGPSGSLGKVVLAQGDGAVTFTMAIKDLPPGPNRMFLYEAGDCMIGSDDLKISELASLNVNITEDGSEPLKRVVTINGVSLDDLKGNALVIDRGGILAEKQPKQPDEMAQVACGVVK